MRETSVKSDVSQMHLYSGLSVFREGAEKPLVAKESHSGQLSRVQGAKPQTLLWLKKSFIQEELVFTFFSQTS